MKPANQDKYRLWEDHWYDWLLLPIACLWFSWQCFRLAFGAIVAPWDRRWNP